MKTIQQVVTPVPTAEEALGAVILMRQDVQGLFESFNTASEKIAVGQEVHGEDMTTVWATSAALLNRIVERFNRMAPKGD